MDGWVVQGEAGLLGALCIPACLPSVLQMHLCKWCGLSSGLQLRGKEEGQRYFVGLCFAQARDLLGHSSALSPSHPPSLGDPLCTPLAVSRTQTLTSTPNPTESPSATPTSSCSQLHVPKPCRPSSGII